MPLVHGHGGHRRLSLRGTSDHCTSQAQYTNIDGYIGGITAGSTNGTEERSDQAGGEDETGVKKPMNPILGETFTCYWDYPDSTRGYYISEQTSHHPPKSSYFFMAPDHGIRIDGALVPRSKFLGNSAASMMEGVAVLRLMNVGKSRGGER
ncbi:MAG: hypothetical protein Q9200_006606 [Gallowayella weberi]